MVKSNATIKVDTAENWTKAVNFVPDVFTIIVYQFEDSAPKIKIGDGKTKVGDLPFLVNQKEVIEGTLVL